jgi:hypothetical protein
MTVQALRSRHGLLDDLMRGHWGSRLGADEKEHGPRVKPGVTHLEARSRVDKPRGKKPGVTHLEARSPG